MAPLHDLPGLVIDILGSLDVVRLPVAYGCRDEDDLCPLQGQQPGRFREPLVPADQDTDVGEPGLEYLVSQIPRCEVELFIVPWIVRDVHLPILAQVAAVGVQDDRGVVVQAQSPLLEQAGDNNDAQICCQCAKLPDGWRVPVDYFCQAVQATVHSLAEVAGLE